jgi:hypothetical protein
MKTQKKLLFGIGIGCAAITFIFIAGIWLFCSDSSPINRASALSVTRVWARLAPYPESAGRKHIEIAGSMFSREFTVEFEASPKDIQNWLKNSPGTKDVVPNHNSNGSLHYQIKPGGGAQFAEIILLNDGTTVRIHTYWS